MIIVVSFGAIPLERRHMMPNCHVLCAAGGEPIHVMVADGVSVANAINGAGIELRAGDQILVRGKAVNPDLVHVKEGDLIIVSQPIAGG